MHNLDIDKKTKQDVSELDLLLMIEMGFFSELKKIKIKINPRPSSNEPHSEDNKPAASKDTFVDLHLKMVKKIDDLLERHKQEFVKDRIALLKQRHKSLKDVVDLRESTNKPPEISHMGTTFVEPGDFTGDLDQREEFFEIEHPLDFPKNADIEQEQDIHSVMMGNQDKKSSTSFWGLGKIKLRKKENVKDKQTNKHVKGKSKINNITKTKLDLEKTKQEIEEKKKALEIAREKGKQKELELKRERRRKKETRKTQKTRIKKETQITKN